MNINPETKPINEIFSIEGKSVYNIPIYQRNYSWNDRNIDSLYSDSIAEEGGYYIGNLLVTPSATKDGFDVVDGQQRLTTIALFLLAIYEELLDVQKFSVDQTEIEDSYPLRADIKRKLLTQQGQPKLNLLEQDAEIFNSYLQILNGKEKGKFGNRTFGKRYNYIREIISNIEADEFNSKYTKIKMFYTKLNDLELLRITVNDLTDAYSVFTSLNAKGLPLTLMDLLKSYYLSEAIQHFPEKKALEEWNRLINIFLNENGEPNATAVTQFLQNNYDVFEGSGTSSVTKRASLRKYEDLFKKNGHLYMEELIINAEIFSQMIPKISSANYIQYGDELSHIINKLLKLETSPVYPLMLYLLKELKLNNISEKKVSCIFSYLVSYYVRRNLVLKPKSSNIRSKAIQTVRILQQNKNKLESISLDTVEEQLGSIKASDLDFKSALKGPIYDIAPQTTRFVLIELERIHGNYFDKQTQDNLDDYNSNGKPIWTLEHILPQSLNLKMKWKEMISPENADLAERLQKEYVHKIGNLTLTGYNSEMSDKEFIEKRDYKPKSSNNYTGLRTKLFINESIFNSVPIDAKESWTIEDIERRTDQLTELIIAKFQ
ncbi:DUF262 domain-containing protein [Exiguobacterium sp. s70]|uniref:DUF262 domain-containing protein n=1 Tax=Exiguobacterium sp. s70 TaxID=2751228 RepID=UPI001BEA3715|nr:DUF262 domain-containing protein [Exiguobacterium sp. s70]